MSECGAVLERSVENLEFLKDKMPTTELESFVNGIIIAVAVIGSAIIVFALICGLWRKLHKKSQRLMQMLYFSGFVVIVCSFLMKCLYVTGEVIKRGRRTEDVRELNIYLALITGAVILSELLSSGENEGELAEKSTANTKKQEDVPQ